MGNLIFFSNEGIESSAMVKLQGILEVGVFCVCVCVVLKPYDLVLDV